VSPPEKAKTSREIEWEQFEKTARKLVRLCSEPGAASRRRQSKTGACRDRRGDASKPCEDELHHRLARLHLKTATTTKRERIEAAPPDSGISADAPTKGKLLLLDAHSGEQESCGAVTAETRPPSYLREEEERRESEEGAQPRRAAWEALKRRVLYAEEHEEHGVPSLDMGTAHAAERALRELRAQLRRGWAEEIMRLRVQEESTRSAKKRRRNAGWWTSENGMLLRRTVTVSKFSCEREEFLPAYFLPAYTCPREPLILRAWIALLPSSYLVSKMILV